MVRNLVRAVYAKLFPRQYKKRRALGFWKWRLEQEGTLGNAHYQPFYTSFFGLDEDHYRDKRILDIGCGPRGSLEWAHMAAERVGLDSLADKYLKLGADQHQMTYVAAPAERIPYADAHFDVVCSFNSLDHVDDLARAVSEIKRVTKPGGQFLLIVEVNHPPWPTEPLTLGWDLLDTFTDAFTVETPRKFEAGDHDIYKQLRIDDRFDESNPADRPGIIAAKLTRRAPR